MLKRNSFIITLALIFVALSGVLYYVHYLIFRDVHHIFIYLLGDLAFLPLEVLLVVLIIERLLSNREKQEKLQKLNMVVGAFFSEVGTYLLRDLLNYFKNQEEISRQLNVTSDWSRKDFQQAVSYAYHLKTEVNFNNLNLVNLKILLAEKRSFILTLLENPNLLEHDRFTDLLWAITHLDEELEARPSVENLPPKDLEHIGGDIQRLYDHLTSEWLDYIEHLKSNYPYLYSLVLRTHPFQEDQSATIR